MRIQVIDWWAVHHSFSRFYYESDWPIHWISFSFRRDEMGTFGGRNCSIWEITCVTAVSLTWCPMWLSLTKGCVRNRHSQLSSQAVGAVRTQELSACQQEKCVSHGPESLNVLFCYCCYCSCCFWEGFLLVHKQYILWSSRTRRRSCWRPLSQSLKPLCQTSSFKI